MASTIKKTRRNTTKYYISTKFLDNKSKHSTNSINTGKNNENRLVYQIITGVKHERQQETGLAGGVIQLSTNGSRTQVYYVNISSAVANSNDQKNVGGSECDYL